MSTRTKHVVLLLVLLGLGACKDNKGINEGSKKGGIEGKIIDAVTTLPIRGATVSTNPSSFFTSSDSTGSFKLSDIDPGIYEVFASSADYAQNKSVVSVAAGQSSKVDIILSRKTGSIKGKITDVLSKYPVRGATISTSPSTIVSMTDSSGNFILLNVPVGSYSLIGSKEGYSNSQVSTDVIFGVTTATDLVLQSLVPLSGLVAYYPFTGSANDSSGNTHHGQLNGPVLSLDRFGQPNSAYEFDGLNDWIEISATAMPTGERTTAAWFFATDLSGGRLLLGYGGNGNCGSVWHMMLNNQDGGSNMYEIQTGCQTNRLLSPFAPSPLTRWILFVATSSSVGTLLYVDGKLVRSGSFFVSGTTVADKDMAIGSVTNLSGVAPFSNQSVGFFKGKIDDVRIYNRALSPLEVLLLYREGGWQ